MKIKKMPAHKSCFHEKRSRKNIKYIVIHYTGNTNDTAANNGKFFQREQSGSRRGVGAHFFVGKKGVIVRSIPMNRVAWSVGGLITQINGAGTYYNMCTNQNSVSIELCSATKGYTDKQAEAVKWLITQYIQKRCPNAKTIIRHWDVNGKCCPAPMAGTNNSKWRHLHNYITKGYQYKAKIKDDAVIYSKPDTFSLKQGIKRSGSVVYITKISSDGKWGRLKKKSADGRYRWILLEKIKAV